MARLIQWQLFIKWNPAGSYVDESAHLLGAEGEMSFVPAEEALLSSGRGVVDSCALTLRNGGGRFSPLNEAGPLYSYIQAGGAYRASVYLRVSIDGGATWARVFTGVAKIPQEVGPTWREGPTVRIECRSMDELALQKRGSTPLSTFQGYHDGAYNEAQIIDALLASAGVTSRQIDVGTITIPWAWLDDESVLEECWALAAACGGRVYADPDGVTRYENFYHWTTAPHTTSQETLSFAAGGYQTLTPVYADGDLYSTVTVEHSSRQVGTADKLWTPDDPVSVPPLGSKKIVARLRQPAYTIDAPVVKATGAGGEDLTSSVSVACIYYAQRVEITLSNSHVTKTAFIANLRLTGRPLVGGPTQEVTRSTTDDGGNGAWWSGRGERTKSLRGNAYIQSEAQADMVARFLLHRLERPRLTFKLGGCLGKPARRLGDKITINDGGVMTSARDAFITSIKWQLNDSGFVQDIEAIDAAQMHPYGSYFVLGTNKLGAGGGSLTAPIFY